MDTYLRSSSIFKAAITAAFAIFGLLTFLSGNENRIKASASGPTPSVTGAPGEANCTACHSDYDVNSGSGRIQISGVPSTYLPGQQIPVTVTVSQADAVYYGFQLTAINSAGQNAGLLTVPAGIPPRMQIVTGIVDTDQRQYIEHTSDGLFIDGVFGSNTWTFLWTAPAQADGPISFYAAGNAADGTGSTQNDYIYTTSSSTAPAASLVTIRGTVTSENNGSPIRNARMTLIDQNGERRSVLTNQFGTYVLQDVPSGQPYVLTVSAKRYRFDQQNLMVNGSLSNIDFVGIN